MHPALNTKGHSASQPGLRGHSIGEVYPWRVVGYGDGSWAVVDCRGKTFRQYWPRPGEDDENERSCNLAHEAARIAKILHPLGRVEETPQGAPANISGPLKEIPERLAGHIIRVQYRDDYTEIFRVSSWQSEAWRTLKTFNINTSRYQRLSVVWLAHSPYVDVWIDLP